MSDDEPIIHMAAIRTCFILLHASLRLSDREAPRYQIVCVFFNIVLTAFDPPHTFLLLLNIYVTDFLKDYFKSAINASK